MPVKLLPQLRLLNPSLPVLSLPTMKLGPSTHSSRVIPIFSRIFPFKLKYSALGVSFPRNEHRIGERRFSARPDRHGSKSGFERGRGEVRVSKSLIEDEAELNDWVSELKGDFFKGGLGDVSDEDRGRSRTRIGGRESFRGGGRESSRGGDRDSFSMKRRREGDSHNSGESKRRINRNPVDSFSRNAKMGRRSDSESDDSNERKFSSQRTNQGFRKGNGDSLIEKSRNAKMGGRLDRELEVGNERKFSSQRMNQGFRKGNGNSLMENKMGRRLDSKLGEFSSQRTNQGFRKGNGNSLMEKRGGRELDFKGLRGKANLIDEDDDEVEGERDGLMAMGSIGDLLSEEESEIDGGDDDDAVLRKKAGFSLGLEKEDSVKRVARSSPEKSDSYLSETRFDQCSISPLSLKGIKDAGYEKMTVVQEATLQVILKGKDVLAKARTGTGKTVAFLLPSIEVIVKSPPVDRDQKRPPIFVLVICPTRELASQAATEANTLLKYHPSIGVQVVIGGTRLALEQKRMQANPCQILVATPGRLRDHIENTAGFATRLMGVKVLVLDEADHLLDMGFRKDIEKIIAAVPKQRQTLLFSATVPEEVRQICHIALKRDHEFINTVQEGSEETHSQVRQMHLVAPLDKHFSLLYVLLKEHMSDDVDYKVLVFCTTAMVTRMVAALLGELKLNVREIHSRKPQSYRTRISDEFRKSKGLILVTSDVSARGVDYPDVTLVIQVGLPADREQYVHRLGRTGRKGKEGQGILLLAPWEEFFLCNIKDLPIAKAPLPSVDPDTKKKVERALSQVEMKNKEAAYQAWLGFYNSNKNVARDKRRLVELANEFSQSMGLDNPPAIPKLVLGKMGLKNVPGLRSK